MQDPARGVPPQLLPHLHLVSSYRYPASAAFTHETAVEYLLAAPKVVRELQPMHWTYLDGPPDNTVMLTWQPLNHLGTNFASDGYVWADVEQAYTVEVRGYILEIYMHRTGYHPPNETMATHSRRRFRITGLKTPNPNLPPCDPSLWIVFYSKAPSIDQLPTSRIPVSPQTQNILGQRRYIQSQGQLARKEFMLHDRNNWPTINLPPHGQQQPPYPQPYAAQMIARQQVPHAPMQQQQVVGYPPGVVPPKAQRTQRLPTAAAPAVPDFSLDDEEVSTGDILDALTPRDISRMRYKNHHEWMEEVLASPYRMDQILPVDLGLGRKGELESLTKRYFYTPGALASQRKEGDGPPPATGKMDPGKAEEFANSVAKRLAEMNAEMESMRKKHARKLEKTKKLSALREAELNLRDAVIDPSDTGDEIWRVEGRLRLEQEEGMSPVDYSDKSLKKKVDDIVNGLQASWGRTVVPVTDIKCVEKGGLQERVQPPPPPPQPAISDANMINTLHYSQYDGATDGGAEAAPGASAPAQGVPTSAPSQPIVSSVAPPQPVITAPQTSEDVVMGGVEPSTQSHATPGQPAAAEGDGDWVMVNKDGQASSASPSKDLSSTVNESTQQPTSTAGAPSTTTAGGTTATVPAAEATVPGTTPGATGEFEDENINTAGEALADYHGDVGGLDIGGIDDSAFGDAFHATEGNIGEHHHETDEIA
ncbi:hypothetical protein A7D00_1391 [Trichophyton violaceum]|uniref:DUF1750 domain-containing protein n=1 Tax=Trichophyton violaceum TaxID=34388 RepID=A0A178FND4_TRIVO|nr:hypothetical protein A7D00_1391 [Trichophyton violaceum]